MFSGSVSMSSRLSSLQCGCSSVFRCSCIWWLSICSMFGIVIVVFPLLSVSSIFGVMVGVPPLVEYCDFAGF